MIISNRSRWTSLAALTVLSHLIPTAQASPLDRLQLVKILHLRACDNPCGYYGQVCCASSEECYTDANNQASCRPAQVAAAASGQWEYWTTTIVETDFKTVTSTGSRLVSSPTSGSNVQCRLSIGESQCGNICCTAAQACTKDLVCVKSGSSPIPTSPNPSASPPLRPTSDVTVTETGAPTTTRGFIPAVGTDGSSIIGITIGGGGLSGGAIAGIVIGSIAGAAILVLFCLCCCVGGCVGFFKRAFGGKKHSDSGASSYGSHRKRPWWGGFGGGGHHSHTSEKKSGLFGMSWGKLVGLIGLIAAVVGYKRHRDNKSTVYSSVYTTSSESSSSASKPTVSSTESSSSGGGHFYVPQSKR
ncbi:hypothetical protein FQN57_005151 [Myotisia sp. PD_48]|nr:hypothetical protein FQN57_005151 [Myotisia sp. PD_48]